MFKRKKGEIIGAVYGLGPIFIMLSYGIGFGSWLFIISVFLFSLPTLTLIPLYHAVEMVFRSSGPLFPLLFIIIINVILWAKIFAFIEVSYTQYIKKHEIKPSKTTVAILIVFILIITQLAYRILRIHLFGY